MLGLGPGSLPTDGVMIGLQQSQTRGLLEDGIGIITNLLTSDEPVTFRNERWDLREARLHLRPFQTRCSTLPSPPSPRPRAPGLPVSTVWACCRWAPLLPQASTRWRCTGMC